MVDPAPPPQVFVNSGSTELPEDFIRQLVWGLTDLGIHNVFIDRDEWWGRDLDHIFTCIEESTIALAIFSPSYLETEWCLDELVKIKEQANKNKILVIPFFFNVSKNDVRDFEGEFGDRFMEMRQRYTKYKYDPIRFQRWETSVMTVSRMEPSFTWKAQSSNIFLAMDVIKEIKRQLDIASDLRFSSNDSHSKMAIGEVFLSAFLVAFLFSLFIARLVFTDVAFFRTEKWLVGFPVTIVVLHQLYCALTQQNKRATNV